GAGCGTSSLPRRRSARGRRPACSRERQGRRHRESVAASSGANARRSAIPRLDMTIHTFARYDLRTTDPGAARLAVWQLHEQARARGAPAHWLGNVGVTDVDATLRRWLALGAEPLGPPE